MFFPISLRWRGREEFHNQHSGGLKSLASKTVCIYTLEVQTLVFECFLSTKTIVLARVLSSRSPGDYSFYGTSI